jgi:hypothetical protein
VLEPAHDEEDDGKEERHDFARGIAGGKTEHNSHADECISRNGSEEYDSPT